MVHLGNSNFLVFFKKTPELAKYAIPTFDLHSFEEFLNYARLLKRSIVKPAAGRKGRYVYRIADLDGKIHFLRGDDKKL